VAAESSSQPTVNPLGGMTTAMLFKDVVQAESQHPRLYAGHRHHGRRVTHDAKTLYRVGIALRLECSSSSVLSLPL
jgi:hypothetical protein